MLVLGHLGTAAAVARWVDRKADLRWVAFFALLADLIDKPLGLIVLRETINNGRIYFHSLLVNLLLSVLLIFYWRRTLVYSLALWLHLLCDRMWMRPWTALWPFTGYFGYRALPLEDWVYSVLNPYNLISEAAGLALLGRLFAHFRLFEAGRLGVLLRTGRLRALEEAAGRPARLTSETEAARER